MEPWNIRVDDSRKEDSRRTFIIFCEDGAVEPAYFETFKGDSVNISTFGNKKQHHAQVDFASEYFRSKGVLKVDSQGKEVVDLDEGAQVWCVFDRDREPNDGKDTAFNDSILAANAKGINTAWSNDDFELWVLLHFEEVDPNDVAYQGRSKYYERLTQVLRMYYPYDSVFNNPKFDYYSTMKSKSKFLVYTYQLMKPNLASAIARAEMLDRFHESSAPKPFHVQCPCTKVHLLVKEILNK